MTNEKNTLLKAALGTINGKLEENLKEYKGKNKVAQSILNYLKAIKNEGLSFINYVSPQMMLQLLTSEDKALKKILSEHHLLTIYTVYDIMQVNFTLDPKYDEVFLLSSESRRAFLTNGCLVPEKKSDKVWKSISRDWADEKKFKNGNFSDWFKCIEITITNHKKRSGSVLKKDNYKKELSGNLVWWGSQLALPKKTKIILSFNQLYPSMYLGSNQTRKTDLGQNEFLLEEQPWSVNALYDKELNVTKDNNLKVNDKGISNKNINSSTLGISKQDMPNDEQLLNFSSIKNTAKSPENFKRIELNVHPKDEDYDLVVTLPYHPPKADMLVSVKIKDKDGDNTEEVVLSTT